MKHLLTGASIAAMLAIAAPALAQAPMTPGAPPSGAPSAGAPAPMAGAPMKASPRKARKASAKSGGKMKKSRGSGDMMTEQLNREELARISGGGAPPAPPPGPPGPPPNAGAGQGGPRPSGR